MSEIKTNKISSLTSSNSDITLDPDGTGNLIVASGNVGIGTSSPSFPLTIENSANHLYLKQSNQDNGWLINTADANGQLHFYRRGEGASPSNNELLTISTGGAVGIGQSSPATPLHINGAPGTSTLRLDAGGTLGGSRRNWAISGEKYLAGGLSFEYGSTEGAAPSNAAMTITSGGTVLINKTSTDFNTAGIRMDSEVNITRANATPVFINRTGNDGGLIQFYQAGVEEGSISVSGTTVSYNGGHLARWSQLADNTKDTSIVKGTVMTNLDQMAEWTKDGVTEENEQLNCMAVSSVEGDANVAGVFVNWDDDDEDYTADMNVAMTGDMVIRIAQGTTVARGDLLMSAGDGTAKPQGDDIVRSKTIAKVTSTTVSHTYDDGSYLVPCVLMAC